MIRTLCARVLANFVLLLRPADTESTEIYRVAIFPRTRGKNELHLVSLETRTNVLVHNALLF